ncbi:M12 family metallo-peptidase [Stenotrophomonas sp. CFBP8980]|uniref:M12 family metallo-peptidase n=1 Tax=Stenotrophomonas sp. CFBP8980 TaxID=3096523 RepID=UPI002A6AC6A9|nr:M12 family metallo-peptidase [Stenotrophomonas sp. CFBP8980]MDY1033329.1 M12 family metallo-peptidase [Stenotrophomonas sp. CFBP8980]
MVHYLLLSGLLLAGGSSASAAPPMLELQDVEASALHAGTPALTLQIEGRPVAVRREQSRALPTGDVAWSGSWDATGQAAAGELSLVRSPAGITAVVHLGEDLWRIVPVGGGRHQTLPLATRQLPMHPPGDIPVGPQKAAAAAPAGTAPTSRIRLLVVATAEAVAGYPGDLRALAELSIAESNLTYQRSGVDMDVELAGYVVTPYVESGNMEQDVRRLRSPGDGYMDEVHALRDQHAADVVVLLMNRAFACGLADQIGADADHAFIAVLEQCATGGYVLAHEIGHLAGARHDIKRDPAGVPFAFGHGYWYQPPRALGWRTVMSYDCPTGCRRIPYWSSPDLSYEGQATGNRHEADNRRVLELTRAKIAGFR